MANAINNPEREDEEVDNNITPEELSLLDDSISNVNDGDDIHLKRSELDNTDEDGDLLNEGSMADDISGDDLDVPGAEDDDPNEAIGEEDEQNNAYSNADTE